jgi:excisionase family DNA binding protein
MKRMLTLAEAAAELGISRITLWRLVETKKLSCVRYADTRRILIERTDLEAFIVKSKTKAAA